jgi:hypothetical protein
LEQQDHKIFYQTSILQFFHKSFHPGYSTPYIK